MRSSNGPTEDATAALNELTYLDEADRQATIFNRSYLDAMTAALVNDDPDECWRHLQSSLFAAIIVSRLVDPEDARGWPGVSRSEARRIAKHRAEMVRTLVGLPEPSVSTSPIYTVREIRNSMEHFDERLDRVISSGSGSISDWYLSDGQLLVSQTNSDPSITPLGLRAFVATAGMLFFNDQTLNMFQLDLDMFALRNNIAEARTEIEPRLQGPFTFGGSQVVEFSDAATRLAALETWEAERVKRVAMLDSTLVGDRREPPNP